MPNLTASVPHQVTREEAKRRIQNHVGALIQQQGVALTNLQESWNGDDMTFSFNVMGQAISGHAKVDDQYVHLTVVLPWLLSMLAAPMKKRIEQQTRQLLAAPPKDAPDRT